MYHKHDMHLELTFFPVAVEAFAKLEYTSNVTGDDNCKHCFGIYDCFIDNFNEQKNKYTLSVYTN